MGFEARETILALLDQAIAEKARSSRRCLRSQRARGRWRLREAEEAAARSSSTTARAR